MSDRGRGWSPLHVRILLVLGLLAVPPAVQTARTGHLPVQEVSAAGQCSPNDRWPVKTGTDADAGKVDLSQTTPATVASMRSFKPPSTFPQNNRIPPVETTLYSVTATLIRYTKMVDQDYHLVLQDSSGRRLLVEVPDPACVGATSPFLTDIRNARAAVDSRLHVTRTTQSTSRPVTVRGVGFWDGTAGGGVHIELHPVLDINF